MYTAEDISVIVQLMFVLLNYDDENLLFSSVSMLPNLMFVLNIVK